MQSLLYTNTIEDIVEFNRFAVRTHAKWEMVKQQLAWGGILGGVVVVLIREEIVVGLITGFLTFLITVALYPSFRYAVISLELKKLAKMDPKIAVANSHRLSIEPDGLREICDVDETFRDWSMVEEVTHAKKHVYIWISRFKAYVIPIDRIDEGDLTLFLEDLEGRIERKIQV